MMIGPQESENKDCYLKKSARLHQEFQHMVGRAVAAANVASIANLLYSMFATVKTWMLYPCFFLVGGYGEYPIFN